MSDRCNTCIQWEDRVDYNGGWCAFQEEIVSHLGWCSKQENRKRDVFYYAWMGGVALFLLGGVLTLLVAL